MNQMEPELNQSVSTIEASRESTVIDPVLKRLSSLDLPGKEHFENYMRYKWRANHKPRTISSSFTSIMFFLELYKASGKTDLTQLTRSDLEAFIV
jgi:hypothetical protein